MCHFLYKWVSKQTNIKINSQERIIANNGKKGKMKISFPKGQKYSSSEKECTTSSINKCPENKQTRVQRKLLKKLSEPILKRRAKWRSLFQKGKSIYHPRKNVPLPLFAHFQTVQHSRVIQNNLKNQSVSRKMQVIGACGAKGFLNPIDSHA